MALRTVFFLVAFIFPVASVAAQQEAAPAANSEDVESIDALITALYDVISGPAQQPRDWDRFRSLLTKDCRFVPITRSQDGTPVHHSMTGQEFIDMVGPYFDSNSFYEKEVARKSEQYGNLVHAFSTYDSFHTLEDDEPFQRGINSIQLIFEEGRWWIANIAWQPAWEGLPIPDIYEGIGR